MPKAGFLLEIIERIARKQTRPKTGIAIQ